MRDGERQQFRLIVMLVLYPFKGLSSSKLSRNMYCYVILYLNLNFSCEHICIMKKRSMKSCPTCFIVAAILQEAFTKSPYLFFPLNLVLKYVFLKMKFISN